MFASVRGRGPKSTRSICRPLLPRLGTARILTLRGDEYEAIATCEVLPELELGRIAHFAEQPDRHARFAPTVTSYAGARDSGPAVRDAEG